MANVFGTRQKRRHCLIGILLQSQCIAPCARGANLTLKNTSPYMRCVYRCAFWFELNNGFLVDCCRHNFNPTGDAPPPLKSFPHLGNQWSMGICCWEGLFCTPSTSSQCNASKTTFFFAPPNMFNIQSCSWKKGTYVLEKKRLFVKRRLSILINKAYFSY